MSFKLNLPGNEGNDFTSPRTKTINELAKGSETEGDSKPVHNQSIDQQEKVFTKWCNHHLKKRKQEIGEGLLTKGALDDGYILWHLLTQLSGKTLRKLDPPKMRSHKLSNITCSLQFLIEERIKTVGIGCEDILDRNAKLIMGLIWTLILRYQLSASGENLSEAKKAIVEWLNSVGVPCTNATLKDVFADKDAKHLPYLVNLLSPGLLPESQLKGSANDNTNTAMDVADQFLDIPKICDVDDLRGDYRDEKIVITYVSFYKDKAGLLSNVGLATLIIDDEILAAASDKRDAGKIIISPRGSKGGASLLEETVKKDDLAKVFSAPRLNIVKKGGATGNTTNASSTNPNALSPRSGASGGSQSDGTPLSPRTREANQNLEKVVTDLVANYMKFRVNIETVLKLRAVNIASADEFQFSASTVDGSPSNDYTVRFEQSKTEKAIWSIHYTPTKEGLYNLDLQIAKKGSDVQTQAGCFPLKANVLPAEERLSIAHGTQFTDRPVNLKLETHNAEGLDIKVVGPDGKQISSNLTKDSLQFTPTVAGKTTVSVTRNGKPIEGSPVTLDVKQAQKCALDNTSVPSTCTPQIESRITLTTKGINKDALKIVAKQNGKPVETKFGNPSQVSLLRASKTGETDYVICFTPHDLKSDKESVQIEIIVADGDNQIEPLKIDIPVTAASWACTSLDQKVYRDGVPASFRIKCQNFKSNEVDIKIEDAKDVSVIPIDDNTIEVNFTPTKSGEKKVDLLSKNTGGAIAASDGSNKLKVVPTYAKIINLAPEELFVDTLTCFQVKTNASKNLTSRVTINDVEVPSAMTKRSKKSTDKSADGDEEMFDVIFTPPSEGIVKVNIYEKDRLIGSSTEEFETQTLTIRKKPFANIKEIITVNPKVNSEVNALVNTNVNVNDLTCDCVLPNGRKLAARVKKTDDPNVVEVSFTSDEATGAVTLAFMNKGVLISQDDSSVHILPPSFVKLEKCPKKAREGDEIKLVFSSNIDKLRVNVTNGDGSSSHIRNVSGKEDGKKKEVKFRTKGLGKTKFHFCDEDGKEVPHTRKEITILPAPVFTLSSVAPAQIEVNKVYTLTAQTNLKPDEVLAQFADAKSGKSLDVSVSSPSSSSHKRHRGKSNAGEKKDDKKEEKKDKQEVVITYSAKNEGLINCAILYTGNRENKLTPDFKITAVPEIPFCSVDLPDDLVIPTNETMSFIVKSNVPNFKCEIIDVQSAAQKIIPTITPAPSDANTSSTASSSTKKSGKESTTSASSTGGQSSTTTLSVCEFVPKHEGNFFVYFLQKDGTPVKGAPRSFHVRTKAQPSLELTKMKKTVIPGNVASFVVTTHHVAELSQIKIMITGEHGSEKFNPQLSWIDQAGGVDTKNLPATKSSPRPSGKQPEAETRKARIEWTPSQEGEYFIDCVLLHTTTAKIVGFPASVTAIKHTDSKVIGFKTDKSEGVELQETCLVYLDIGGKVDKIHATVQFFNKEKEKLSLVQVNKNDDNSREYVLKFTAKHEGPAHIEVTYRNKHIDGSPLHFDVNPEPFCVVDFDSTKRAFVNEHFFFLISTSRNVPTDQIKYVATERGGKSCTFVPDRIESKTRVMSKTTPPYPLILHNYYVYWKFEGDKETSVKTEVTIYGKHIAGSPFTNKVEQEAAIFSGPLRWSKLVDAHGKDGMEIEDELEFTMQWQTSTSRAVPLEYSAVTFSHAGEVIESFDAGRDSSASGACMRWSSHKDGNEEYFYVRPDSLFLDVACVAIYVICKEDDFSKIGKFCMSISKTKGKVKLPAYSNPSFKGERENAFLVGFVVKSTDHKSWRFFPGGEYAYSRHGVFFSDLLPLYHKQTQKYITTNPLPSAVIAVGARYPVYPDIDKLYFNCNWQFNKAQRMEVSAAVYYFNSGENELPLICDARRNRYHGITVPSAEDPQLTVNFGMVIPDVQTILLVANSEDDHGELATLQNVITTVSASNAQQKKAYEVARFNIEKWRMNCFTSSTVAVVKITRRSANAVWEIVPLGVGFQQQGIDELITNQELVSLIPVGGDKDTGAFSPRKAKSYVFTKDVKKDGKKNPSPLEPLLDTFWAPTPLCLKVFVMHASDLATNDKKKIAPFVQFEKGEKADIKLPTQYATKTKQSTNNPAWNELFVFDNLVEPKEGTVYLNVLCSFESAANPAFIGQVKLNIKKIFSEAVHKGPKGIEATYKLDKNSNKPNPRPNISGEIVLRFMAC